MVSLLVLQSSILTWLYFFTSIYRETKEVPVLRMKKDNRLGQTS